VQRLQDDADARRAPAVEPGAFELEQAFAGDFDLAFAWAHQPGEDVQQRRLAAA
jgi:hypothetical protein